MDGSELVLALDVGTTWAKAAYVAPSGAIVADGRCYIRGGPLFGHDTQDLGRIWRGCIDAVEQARQQINSTGSHRPPGAIAITAHKATGIWLDRNDEPVGVPHDATAAAGRKVIEECYASDIWGTPGPFAYGYAIDLIGNTRWLRLAYPDRWRAIQRAGNLHSWLMLQMTGEWVTSNAGGPVQDTWPAEAAQLSGLPLSAFPAVHEDCAISGRLTDVAAKALSIPEGIPIATGTHDGAAANLGIGAIHPGDGCITLGTNGVLRVVTGDRLPRRFGYTITDNRWALVRDITGLAPQLDAVVRTIHNGSHKSLIEQHEALTAQAIHVAPGCDGLEFPVRASGSAAKAAALASQALSEGHDAATIYRAALEGAGFAFLGLSRMAEAAGAPIKRYLVTGGAKANDLLVQILSANLQAPIERSDQEEGITGVACLAAVGAGWYSSVEDAAGAMVHYGPAVEADETQIATYQRLASNAQIPTGTAPDDADSGD